MNNNVSNTIQNDSLFNNKTALSKILIDSGYSHHMFNYTKTNNNNNNSKINTNFNTPSTTNTSSIFPCNNKELQHNLVTTTTATGSKSDGQKSNITSTSQSGSNDAFVGKLSSSQVRQKLKECVLSKKNNKSMSSTSFSSPQNSFDSEDHHSSLINNHNNQPNNTNIINKNLDYISLTSRSNNQDNNTSANTSNNNSSNSNNNTTTNNKFPIRKTSSLPNLKVRSALKQKGLDRRPSPLSKKPSKVSLFDKSTNSGDYDTKRSPPISQTTHISNNNNNNPPYNLAQVHQRQLQQHQQQQPHHQQQQQQQQQSYHPQHLHNHHPYFNIQSSLTNQQSAQMFPINLLSNDLLTKPQDSNNCSFQSSYNLPLQALFNSSQPQLIPPFASLPNLNIAHSLTALLSSAKAINLSPPPPPTPTHQLHQQEQQHQQQSVPVATNSPIGSSSNIKPNINPLLEFTKNYETLTKTVSTNSPDNVMELSNSINNTDATNTLYELQHQLSNQLSPSISLAGTNQPHFSNFPNYKIKNRILNRTNSAPLPLGCNNNTNNNNNINNTNSNMNTNSNSKTNSNNNNENNNLDNNITTNTNNNNNTTTNNNVLLQNSLQLAMQEQKYLMVRSNLRAKVINRCINNSNQNNNTNVQQSIISSKPLNNNLKYLKQHSEVIKMIDRNLDFDFKNIACTRTLSDSLITGNGRLPQRSLSLDDHSNIKASSNNNFTNNNRFNNSAGDDIKCSSQDILDLCLLQHRLNQFEQLKSSNNNQSSINPNINTINTTANNTNINCSTINSSSNNNNNSNINNNINSNNESNNNNNLNSDSFRILSNHSNNGNFIIQSNSNSSSINKLPSPILEEKIIEYPHTTAIAYDVGMLNHRCLCGNEDIHPESSRRLSCVWDRLNSSQIVMRCHVIPGKKASMDDLQLCHRDTYSVLFGANPANRLKINPELLMSVDFCRLPCGGIGVDSDTIWNNVHTANAARLAVGCVIELTLKVVRGELRNGFALVRPPGHHAEFSQAVGFGYFNSVAIAARKVIQQTANIRKVVVIDWDIHHGNGTQQMFYGDSSVLYISLHRHDAGHFFPGTGSVTEIGESNGVHFNINIPWCSSSGSHINSANNNANSNNTNNTSMNCSINNTCNQNFDFNVAPVGDAEYLAAFIHIIIPIISEFQPDLMLVSAGFDATKQHPNNLGGYSVSPACFGWMTQRLVMSGQADGRVVLALEGGFDINSLCDCVEACMWSLIKPDKMNFIDNSSMARMSNEDKFTIPSTELTRTPIESAVETLNSVVQVHKKKWHCLRHLTKDILRQSYHDCVTAPKLQNYDSIPLVAMAELTVRHHHNDQNLMRTNQSMGQIGTSDANNNINNNTLLNCAMDCDSASPINVNVLDVDGVYDDDDDNNEILQKAKTIHQSKTMAYASISSNTIDEPMEDGS